MSKLTLKLDEANDLNFQFKVLGTSSEPNAGNIQFRFVVFEQNNPSAIGYIFPVTAKEEDGTITVSIPETKDIFKEQTSYLGKVEVIIGTRLLVPTTMELEFVRSMAVEVTMLPSKTDDRKSIEDLLPDLEEENIPSIKEDKPKFVTMTKSQLQALILEKTKKKTMSPIQIDPMKASLKDLMKSALKDS